MKDLNRKMAGGAAWMVLLRFCFRGIGIVSTIILARLLVPADFGIVAMAMSIIAAFELMTAFGFDTVLIQKQEAHRDHYDTAWTFNVLFAVFAGGMLVVFADAIASFYEEPRLPPVLMVLGAGFAISGLENIQVVNFRKNLDFRKEFMFRLLQKLAGFVVTVPLAFALRSYWALVAGMLAGNVLKVVLSYWYLPYLPRPTLAAAASLFSFSKWLFLNKLLFFLRKRSGDFILGKLAGAGALGVYNLSNEISQLAGTEITAPITRAVFPAYAKVSKDLEILRKGYLDVITVVACLALPAGFGLAAVADLLVPLLLGSNWLAAIPVIEILAISGGLRALGLNSGAVFNALGRPRVVTFMATINVLVLLPAAIYWSGAHGATGLASAYLLSFCVMLPISFGLTLRAVQARWGALFAILWRPAVATAAMYGAVQGIGNMLPAADAVPALFGSLLVSVAGGALAYVAVFGVLWHLSGRPAGAEVETVRFVVDRLRRVTRRTAA